MRTTLSATAIESINGGLLAHLVTIDDGLWRRRRVAKSGNSAAGTQASAAASSPKASISRPQ